MKFNVWTASWCCPIGGVGKHALDSKCKKCEPWRHPEPTVQCCDCGSYYHTHAAWQHHVDTTTHIQCTYVDEHVEFFTKDADFSEPPASKPCNQKSSVEAEVDDPAVPAEVLEQEAEPPPTRGDTT